MSSADQTTYLVFSDRDQFDRALAEIPLLYAYAEMVRAVDSIAMHVKLGGNKTHPKVAAMIRAMRSSANKHRPLSFKVHNPHPPGAGTMAKKSKKKSGKKRAKKKVAKKRAKKARGVCARKGKISPKARRQLPNNAFALPSLRMYPLYKLVDGRLAPSASHAQNAKARARAALSARRIDQKTYKLIVRKANVVLSKCSPAVRKARSAAKSSAKRSLSQAQARSVVLAEINRLAGT